MTLDPPHSWMEAEAGVAADVASRVRALRRLRGGEGGDGGAGPKKIVIIASTSRAGSSIFAEMLRHSRRLLHFPGEVNPAFVLNGHAHPLAQTGSDALRRGFVSPLGTAESLRRDLAEEAGRFAGDGKAPPLPDRESVWRFAIDLACRLTLQWPSLHFSGEEVHDWLRATLHTLEREQGWEPGYFPSVQLFHAIFLAEVRRHRPLVNPRFYDLDRELLARFHGEVPPAEGSPGPVLIEEPPFITISPWEAASSSHLGEMPVVMKSPSLVYRFDFLEELFPQSEIRLLHLTRNAAASINGLVDGWQYPGFHARRVPVPLSIQGYSHLPGGREWWKFDLPPEWEKMARSPLTEVCAFQWRSATAAVLAHLEARPDRRAGLLRIRFEDLMGDRNARESVWNAIDSWLEVSPDPSLRAFVDGEAPPMMATTRPRSRRWFARVDLLDPLIRTAEVGELMERMGYDPDPRTWE